VWHTEDSRRNGDCNLDQSDLLSQLTQAVEAAIERTNYEVNVAASGSTDCRLQMIFNYSSAPEFVHRCHLDIPAWTCTAEDRALLGRLGVQEVHQEFFNLVLDRAGHDAPSIAHTLALLLMLLSGGSDQIEEVDWYDLDENRAARGPFVTDYPLPVLTFSDFLESLERERGQIFQDGTQHPSPPPQVMDTLQGLPDATNLQRDWPSREAQLRKHVESGGFTNGSLDEAIERVWIVAQMYLLFLDNGDHDFDVDDSVRRHYTELAHKRPACPIDEEVMAWMPMYLNSMTRFEISLALCCVTDRVGRGLVFSGAFDENLADLIAKRGHSLAAKDTTQVQYP